MTIVPFGNRLSVSKVDTRRTRIWVTATTHKASVYTYQLQTSTARNVFPSPFHLSRRFFGDSAATRPTNSYAHNSTYLPSSLKEKHYRILGVGIISSFIYKSHERTSYYLMLKANPISSSTAVDNIRCMCFGYDLDVNVELDNIFIVG